MKKVWILLLLVILLVAGGIGFIRVRAYFQKPLAAPLAVVLQSTPTQVVLATSAPVVAALAPTSTPVSPGLWSQPRPPPVANPA